MTDVLDVSRDNETGEITQFLILDESGVPTTKVASPENMLLYDPTDELPFDGGMDGFLNGSDAVRVSEDPEIIVAPSGSDHGYLISKDSNVVETCGNDVVELLRGVYDAIVDGNVQPLCDLFEKVAKQHVRQHVVNNLVGIFNADERIEVTSNGWLVDGFYFVTWRANLYKKDEDEDATTYERSAGSVVEHDTAYELIKLDHNISTDEVPPVTIDDTVYELTEREILFLSKIEWLCNRRYYYPDMEFWMYTDKWADMSVETGKPDVADGENLDSFEF